MLLVCLNFIDVLTKCEVFCQDIKVDDRAFGGGGGKIANFASPSD